jgi:hypothetical protein
MVGRTKIDRKVNKLRKMVQYHQRLHDSHWIIYNNSKIRALVILYKKQKGQMEDYVSKRGLRSLQLTKKHQRLTEDFSEKLEKARKKQFKQDFPALFKK